MGRENGAFAFRSCFSRLRLLLTILLFLASCVGLWLVHFQLRPEQTPAPQLSINGTSNFSQGFSSEQPSCQSLFSEQNPTEHWIFKSGCPLPADWSWFLAKGTSSLEPAIETLSLGWNINSSFNFPRQSRLFFSTDDLLGDIIAIHLQFTNEQFPSPLQLHLVSIDRKQTVQLKELHRTGALHTAPLGTLENGSWSGLEFRNAGHEKLAFGFDALYLQVRSPAELLNKQVLKIKAMQQEKTKFSGPSLLVGVLSKASHHQLRTRVVPLFASHGGQAKMVVFVGNSTSKEVAEARAAEYGGLPLVWLDVEDGYPPRLKDLAMWRYMYEHFATEYDWFMHLDDDAYVDFERLGDFLRGFDLSDRAAGPLYLGGPTTGAKFDPQGRPLNVEKGKHGELLPYCVGGPAYVLNRVALQKMGPHIGQCAVDWSSWHSDVEVGRCVTKHAGVACGSEPFSENEMKARFKSAWKADRQILLPPVLEKVHLNAIALHPVKMRGLRSLANHMATVGGQVEAAKIQRRYLSWDGVESIALRGGYKALRLALTCALREARVLQRIPVIPALVPDGKGGHVSVHQLFDVQEAGARLGAIESDSAEWTRVLQWPAVYIGSGDQGAFIDTKDLSKAGFGEARVLVRRFAPYAQGLQILGEAVEAFCQGFCSKGIEQLEGAPYGLRIKKQVVSRLATSHKLLKLYESFRKKVRYYDAVKFAVSAVPSSSLDGRRLASLVGTVVTSVKAQIKEGRTVFVAVDQEGGLPAQVIEALQELCRIYTLKDVTPSLQPSSLVAGQLEDLIYRKGFTRLKIHIDAQALVAENQLMLDPPLASQTPAVSLPESAQCHGNPILIMQRWMKEHGYGPYFRKELPKELRECPPGSVAVVTPEQFLEKLSVFILTLPGQRRWEGLAQKCRLHGFKTAPWIAVNGSDVFQHANETKVGVKKLKPGELGVLASMRDLFLHAQELRLPAILVLEDDALLHKQFGERLKELLSTSARCSNYLRGGSSGGVLLLGATEWSLDAWNWIRDEVDTRVYDATEARCYNANLQTYGAFATIYHQDTFISILEWIGVQLSSREEPYDHVYQHLAANGTIVRVAYPYLAVADVSHASSVDPERSQDVTDRSLRHEWNLSLYHDPAHDVVS